MKTSGMLHISEHWWQPCPNFLDVLLPSNSNDPKIHFDILDMFVLTLYCEYIDLMRLANHDIVFLFTFYTQGLNFFELGLHFEIILVCPINFVLLKM